METNTEPGQVQASLAEEDHWPFFQCNNTWENICPDGRKRVCIRFCGDEEDSYFDICPFLHIEKYAIKDLLNHIEKESQQGEETPAPTIMSFGEIAMYSPSVYKDADINIAKAIHYPECWDIAAYPSLASALWEISILPKGQPCPTCGNPHFILED